MSLFNKLKNDAAGAVSKVGGAAAGQVLNAAAGAVRSGGNRSWTVVFQEFPMTADALRSLPEATLREPHFAAALLIPALCLWPLNQPEALAMINFLKGPEGLSTREVQFISERLRGKEYVPSSYFNGATPNNNYDPTEPYTVVVTDNPYSYQEQGYAKLYLQSSGADSPRPVQLRQRPSSGEWFLWDQMLLSDIRQPVSADPWA